MLLRRFLFALLLLPLVVAACRPAATLPPASQAAAVATPIAAPATATATPEPPAVPAPTATATPAGDATVAAFAEALRQAIDRGDKAAMQAAMADHFNIIWWMGDGLEYTPTEAVAVLQKDYLAPNGAARINPGANLAALLGNRPLAFFAPEFKAEKAWLLTGLGRDGKGEGLAFIARQPGGAPYWNGLLYAPEGFNAEGMATYLKWQTYANARHGFTLQYPDGWQAVELPNKTYQSGVEQVWLAAGKLPPPNTGAMPDVAVTITAEDPSPQWAPQYFDDYKAEAVMLGAFPATRFRGVNKESQAPMEAVIARVGDVYLQVTPGQNPDNRWQYEVILTTFAPL